MDIDPKIARYLGENEEVWHVSRQIRYCWVWPFFPDYVVLTNQRLFILRPYLTGTKIEDMLWLDIEDIEPHEHIFSATLTCIGVTGEQGQPGAVICCKGLKKGTAMELYRKSRGKVSEMKEYRRFLLVKGNKNVIPVQ